MIWTTTGHGKNTSTSASVSVCAYGENGVSEPVVLGSGEAGKLFRGDATDEFEVRMFSGNEELIKQSFA